MYSVSHPMTGMPPILAQRALLKTYMEPNTTCSTWALSMCLCRPFLLLVKDLIEVAFYGCRTRTGSALQSFSVTNQNSLPPRFQYAFGFQVFEQSACIASTHAKQPGKLLVGERHNVSGPFHHCKDGSCCTLLVGVSGVAGSSLQHLCKHVAGVTFHQFPKSWRSTHSMVVFGQG